MNPPDVIVCQDRVYRLDRIASPLTQDVRVTRAAPAEGERPTDPLAPGERELTFHLVRIFDQGRALLARGDEFEIDLALRLLRTLDLPGFGPPDPLSVQGGCFACGKPHVYELLAPPVRGGISTRRRSYWMCQEHLDSMKPKRPYHAH